ncbi:MAG TPA: cupin domain-containing protein [Streptomyces sp.]
MSSFPAAGALGLAAGADGWWTGAWHTTTTADGTPVMRQRTVLMEPDARPAWRRSTSDTVLFLHEGGAAVALEEAPADGAVLGGDLFQYVVPAGVRHALVPVGSGHVLWSEAEVPGPARWEREPAPDHLPVAAPVPAAGLSAGTAERLGLTAHPEGGYYREIYQSAGTVATERGPRLLANTIHYLLDSVSPVGHLHLNVSDITHFLHAGGPIHYLTVSPDGELHRTVLGYDVERGETPVFTCPGGWWKTSFLPDGTAEGLISEIVAPGFDFADQRLARVRDLAAFPAHAPLLTAYVSH